MASNNSNNEDRITVRIPGKTKASLRKLARADRRTLNAYVRNLLIDAVRNPAGESTATPTAAEAAGK